MRKRKYMMAQFTFYDRTGIQRILEAQAEKGWQLDRISTFGWRFRRITPKHIHFAVTYFPGASQFDPGPGAAQQELFDFCAHSGWVLVGTTAQIQIFYNERSNPVPIETDPGIELENIHRSAKRNFLPAYGMLLFLAVFNMSLQISQIRSFPLQYLSAETTLFSIFCQIILLLITGQELGGYFLWYRRAKKAAENGRFVETKGHRKFQLFLLWGLVVSIALMLLNQSPRYAVSFLTSIGMFFAIYGIVYGITCFLKRQGASAATNRNVTMILTVLLSFALAMGLGYALVKLVRNPIWEVNRIVGTTQVGSMQFDIYGDEIPMNVEDLMDISSPDYSRKADKQSTILLKREEYDQRIWGPSELPDLGYVIYTSRIPKVYELCVRELASGKYGDVYQEEDATLWEAQQVFRQYHDGRPSRRFILCYENKVIVFVPGWDLTKEQMKKVGQILGK